MIELHTVDTQIEMMTSPGAAGSLRNWGDGTTAGNYVQEDERCTVNPASSREAAELAKDGIRISHSVYFWHDPAKDTRHRLLWTDNAGNQHKLMVRHGPIDASGQGRLWKLFCEELQDVDAADFT